LVAFEHAKLAQKSEQVINKT
jgi:hypothetical protein